MDSRTGELKQLSELDARDIRSGAFVPVKGSDLTKKEKEEKFVPEFRRAEVSSLVDAPRHVRRRELKKAKKAWKKLKGI